MTANPGAALGEGLNSGADFAGKVISGARQRQQYQQDQSARTQSADAVDSMGNTSVGLPGAPGSGGSEDANPQANTQAHTNFLQSLGQGLSSIGTGINNFFAGAPAAGAKPGAAPASGLPAQPGPAGAPAGMPTTAAPPNGPPVGLPQNPGSPTAGVSGGAPAFMADGGPVPSPGDALGAGLNNGASFGQAVVNNVRATQQYDQNQTARQAEAHPIEQFASHLYDANHDNGPPTTADASSNAANDVGLPNQQVAAAAAQKGANPAQASAVGLTAKVAQDPGAQQGTPEATPHSLTSNWWDENDKLMFKAASAAAAAGHDPDAVFQSLNHMRTSYVQGHMLRAASAASVALQNGDMKAVEQNLRNMNYYLPDGKDLTIQKDSDGNLVYQNPLQQYVDSRGMPTDQKSSPDGKPNRPNMIPVDQAHIQLLGQAILDPMKVNETLMGTRAASAKQALEAAQTQAQVNDSTAKLTDAQTRSKHLASQAVLDLSHAEYFRARGAAMQLALGKLQKLDPTVLRGSQAAASAVADAFLGPKKQVEDVDKNGEPNLSPAAGKVIHDAQRVDPALRNATAMDQAGVMSHAADLYAANARAGMSHWDAAHIALQVFAAKNKTHRGPNGQQQPDAYTHEESGEVGLWDPKQKAYRTYKILPGSGDAARGGEATQKGYMSILAANGGSDDVDNTNADDNAPAVEPK